jgi:NADH:quinone reductase (non-electrogenic)
VKVVVVGGGYAGLACLMDLRKLAPRAQLHLVDPCRAHVKQTQLHEALQRPLDALRVPFAELAARYGFEHHRYAAGRAGAFDARDLRAWHDDGALRLGSRRLDYDYLVIATGARPRLRATPGTSVWDQCGLRHEEGHALVRRVLLEERGEGRSATVVGGGASGVQYAFALSELLQQRGSSAQVRLVDSEARVLTSLPQAAADYVRERMAAAGIVYLPRTTYVGQAGTRLQVQGSDGAAPQALESQLSLLFGGVEAYPLELHANRYGQVVLDGKIFEQVFAAGDCARYAARGLDAKTAQAAVRKGKHVAANISRLERGRLPVAYGFQELGYVVSLGRFDAVGWLLLRERLVHGVAATAMRRMVEAQYDLFVDGLDTYVL